MQIDNQLEWHENEMPFSTTFDDHFFSHADGRLETDHVFLRGNRVQERWGEQSQFSICELGFGTGLNLVETWRQWMENRQPSQQLTFTSFELYPMQSDEIERALTPWPMLFPLRDQLLSKWPNALKSEVISLDEQTQFHLIVGDVRETLPNWDSSADAWFLDGFAPSKNPQMWEEDLMKFIGQKTNENGTFATYTAAGWVRRNLQAAGFDVEKCKGHAGKREMMHGILSKRD
jgi:tRNA U34 5-methylaminomethyl-2-thiouridine-forming methyltransferase MnmC